MDYYINITLKPDSNMRENVFLNQAYSKLHGVLVSLKSTDIGVSFPKYKVVLGNVIRIHGSADRLEQLQPSQWLGELINQCDLSKILPVPSSTCHRVCSREQPNMSKSKLNRLIKRGSISSDQVKGYVAKMFGQGISHPFLELKSVSNGHKHRRYIAFSPITQQPTLGAFDQFGLSKSASIPWFQIG